MLSCLSTLFSPPYKLFSQQSYIKSRWLYSSASFTLSGQQLRRKVPQHLVDKVADKLADTILEENDKQLVESYTEEFSRLGLSFLPPPPDSSTP